MADKYQFKNQDDRTKIQKICDFFKMGRVLNWTSLQITAPCMSLMKLQTNQGTYNVKEYSNLKKNQLKNVFYIKKYLNSQNIPLCLSLDQVIYEDEISCWIATPWVFGQCLKLEDISILHVGLMAKILAKIHKLNFNLPEASPVLNDHIIDTDFSDAKFLYFRGLFEQHRDSLKENLVISHGDVLPQNVIWTSDQNPVLIDWDNAGWINQDIDLFNTAINWAGIESGVFNKLFYDYFIEVYLSENPRKIQIDQALISASLGSWLNWWVFNDQLGNQEAVKLTLRSLDVLKREFF